MVKRHARKNEARGRRRDNPDESHRQAVDAVRREDDGGGLVLVVDYPDPELDGAEACPECTGSGMSADLYEQPTDGDRPPLLVGRICPGCKGCGRAGHDECTPGVHATDDPAEVDDYLAELDDEELDDGERCPSCHGREFNVVESVPSPEEIEGGPYGELLARARERGLTEWEITDAAAFGELDARFGAGAQALAEQAERQVAYLRMPCGCTADRVRTVHRSELEVIA